MGDAVAILVLPLLGELETRHLRWLFDNLGVRNLLLLSLMDALGHVLFRELLMHLTWTLCQVKVYSVKILLPVSVFL